MNLLNAIEKAKVLATKGHHRIFLGTAARYAQNGSREGLYPRKSPRGSLETCYLGGVGGNTGNEMGVESKSSRQIGSMCAML